MELLRLQAASKELGVSYPTLKRWIYQQKLRSVRTPGGHYRIPRSEVTRLTESDMGETKLPVGVLKGISGRNKLRGRVTDVRFDGLLAQVTLDVSGQSVTAIITDAACRDLGLKKGVLAFALVKATEVMIVRG